MIPTLVTPDLPLAQSDDFPRERADAARNRKRILDAAAALVSEHGIEHVSMDDVAAAAEVGTGTLYRRFGDRAGLALALLQEEAVVFQEAFLHGPPPLGPGAPAHERLSAWGERYAELMEEHADLIFAASPRPGVGPEPAYATHLAVLLRDAAPHVDAEFTAQALLASLGPVQHLYARRVLGWPLDRVQAGWRALVSSICAAA
jgi:AcrR family transcriptional regulator